MNYLADINVWIALVADQHVHHPAASRWFRNLGDDKLAFCSLYARSREAWTTLKMCTTSCSTPYTTMYGIGATISSRVPSF